MLPADVALYEEGARLLAELRGRDPDVRLTREARDRLLESGETRPEMVTELLSMEVERARTS